MKRMKRDWRGWIGILAGVAGLGVAGSVDAAEMLKRQSGRVVSVTARSVVIETADGIRSQFEKSSAAAPAGLREGDWVWISFTQEAREIRVIPGPSTSGRKENFDSKRDEEAGEVPAGPPAPVQLDDRAFFPA